jgi:hypothetical protein
MNNGFERNAGCFSFVNTVTNAWPGALGCWNEIVARSTPKPKVSITAATKDKSFISFGILRFVCSSSPDSAFRCRKLMTDALRGFTAHGELRCPTHVALAMY